MKKYFLPIFVFLVYLVIAKPALAVLFSHDTVYLVHNETRVNKNAIFLASYKSYSNRCEDGICSIGQQFYPVTIYLPKHQELLTSAEFSSNHPYTGGSRDGEAKEAWVTDNNEKYLAYLSENSESSLTFDPGPSEGGTPCETPGPNCLGGIAGSPRTFNVEVASEEFTFNKAINTIEQNSWLVVFGGIALGVILFLGIKKVIKR